MPAGVGFVVDVAFVLVFAAVGRASHQEGNAVVGALATAWPFLVGTGVGWALVRATSLVALSFEAQRGYSDPRPKSSCFCQSSTWFLTPSGLRMTTHRNTDSALP